MKKTNKRNWLFDLKSIAVVGLLLITSVATAQLNGTYTVHDDSPTAGTNFNNVKDLTDTLTAAGVSGPVIINIVPDTFAYEGQFKLSGISGLSSINTLTINGNNQEITSDINTLAFQDVSYVTVSNMKVRSTGLSHSTVFIKQGCSFITFQNGEVITEGSRTSSQSMHFQIGNGLTATSTPTSYNSNITVKGNTLHSNGNATGAYCGIACNNRDTATADQNILIEDNTIEDFGRYGYYGRFNSGVTIKNNTVKNNIATVNTGTKYGIYTYNSSFGSRFSPKSLNSIIGNKVEDLGSPTSTSYVYGIYTTNSYGKEDLNIINNTVSINTGGSLYAIRASGASTSYASTPGNKNIMHNTIYVTGTKTTSFSYQRLIYSYYNDGNIQNNLMYCNAKNVYVNYGIYLNYNNGIVSHNNLDLRDMTYTSTSTSKYYTYLGFNTNTSTPATFLASTEGANSLVENPNFGTGTLIPMNLLLGDKGTSSTNNPVYTDINNAVRDSFTPDLGAYELDLDAKVTNFTTLGSVECSPYTENFNIRVQNTSSTPVTNIPVIYNIEYAGTLNPATLVTEIISDTLAPGASLDYTFNTPAILTGDTLHTINTAVKDWTYLQVGKITTVLSPSPVLVTAGTVFDGYNNGGITSDLLGVDYINTYSLTYPNQPVNRYSIEILNATGDTSTSLTLSGDTLATWAPDTAISDDEKTLSLTVSSIDTLTGCVSSTIRTMELVETPTADFVANNICLGDVAQFKNKSTLNGTGYILTNWEFNDPDASITDDNSDIKDGFWKYSTYGNVDVDMTVSNGVYPKFTYTTTKSIIVTPKPVLDFKVLNACEGSPVSIANNSTLPVNGTITYDWNFGGEYTSTDVNPSYTFTTAGQRTIEVTATANGCSSTASKNAYQFEMPTADFSSIGECNFSNVEFTNSSTIANGTIGYAWDFNGEGISREANPVFTFNTGGNKTISLTARSQFGCVNVITKGITLQESPEADFSFDRACNLTPINFTRTGFVPNNGNNSTYTWNFNGESTTAQENPSYLFNKVGSKDVTLTIEDLNGCSSTVTKSIDVLLQANANFEVADVCEGQEAVFVNRSTVASGDLSYEWSFGDGETSTLLSPTYTYGEAKSYNVNLKATIEGGCDDEMTSTIVVNPAPNANFTVVKDGRQVEVDAPEGNDIYRWTFGDGSRSDQEDVTYIYENVDQGAFTICLATKKGTCWSEDCKDVTLDLAGIENLIENNDMINVYPNPTTGKFNVKVEDPKDVVIKVGDILGNVLDITVIDNYNGTFSIDLSIIADGVYFVQVKNGDFFATKRIKVSK